MAFDQLLLPLLAGLVGLGLGALTAVAFPKWGIRFRLVGVSSFTLRGRELLGMA